MEYYSTIKKEMKPGHCRDVNRPRVCHRVKLVRKRKTSNIY